MGKKKAILLGGLGLVTLATFSALFAMLLGGDGFSPEHKLQLAMSLLEEGRWDVAGRIARDLERSGTVDTEANSAWHFVQGVSQLQSIEDELEFPKHRELLTSAVEHLRTSHDMGFPLGQDGRGDYYFALGLFHLNDWVNAGKLFKRAAVSWPQRRGDALQYAFAAELRKIPPAIEQAEENIVDWESIAGLSDEERQQIGVAKAKIAALRSQWDKSEELLEVIHPDSDEYIAACLGRGEWRVDYALQDPADSAQLEEKLEEAERLFRIVKLSPNSTDSLRRQASYLSGIGFRLRDMNTRALSTFGSLRQLSAGTPEAVAAGVQEAEIQLELGQPEDVVATVHHLLNGMQDLRYYDETWMSVDELRTRLFDIITGLLDRTAYEKAIELSELLAIALPPADSVRQKAKAYQRWAEDENAVSTFSGREDYVAHRRQVRELFRTAGEMYRELARLELRSEEFPEILWKSIACYKRSGAVDEANELLNDYLLYEQRNKRPRGFLALGQNHINAGHWQQALIPLNRCIMEYPEHPLTPQARVIAAQAHAELEQLSPAIAMLETNLYDGQLEPQSDIWRDSLFKLGEILYRQGTLLSLDAKQVQAADEQPIEKLRESHENYLTSISKLGEAVERYSDDPRHNEASYLVAKAYRQAAELPKTLLANDDMMTNRFRRRMQGERQRLLEKALEGFRKLKKHIGMNPTAVETEFLSDDILRNCYFGEADTLYELERFQEAIAAYRSTGSRYLNRPEALEAFMQLAQCHRQLGQEEEARRALDQAKKILAKIPREFDPQFAFLTRTSRDEWEDLIDWYRSWQ